MAISTSADDKPDPFNSPTFLISTMFAAHRSGDHVLERLVNRRLAEVGIRISFASDLPQPARRKVVSRG